jgi:hypothetical protein
MLSFFPYNIFIEICHSNTLYDIRLINYAAFMNARPHIYFRIFMKMIMHQATSIILFCVVYKNTWSDDVPYKLINTSQIPYLYIQFYYRILVSSPLYHTKNELLYENA